MKEFISNNLDILQDLEGGIIDVYDAEPSLLDADAKDAVDALFRHYHAEEEGRRPSPQRLSSRAQRVFDSVRQMSEWRLGRAQLDGESVSDAVPVGAIVGCLREIQKSIPFWTREYGRRGYLEFVSEHMA